MWLVTVRVEVAVYHGWSRCRDVMCKEPGLGNELNIHKIYDLGKQVMGGHRTSLFRFRLGRTALPQHSLYCHLVLNSAAFAFKFELHGNGDMAATSYFFVTTLSFQLYTPCLGLLNLVITRRALHVYVIFYTKFPPELVMLYRVWSLKSAVSWSPRHESCQESSLVQLILSQKQRKASTQQSQRHIKNALELQVR